MNCNSPPPRDVANDRARIIGVGLAALGQLRVEIAYALDPDALRGDRYRLFFLLCKNLLGAQGLQDSRCNPLRVKIAEANSREKVIQVRVVKELGDLLIPQRI